MFVMTMMASQNVGLRETHLRRQTEPRTTAPRERQKPRAATSWSSCLRGWRSPCWWRTWFSALSSLGGAKMIKTVNFNYKRSWQSWQQIVYFQRPVRLVGDGQPLLQLRRPRHHRDLRGDVGAAVAGRGGSSPLGQPGTVRDRVHAVPALRDGARRHVLQPRHPRQDLRCDAETR